MDEKSLLAQIDQQKKDYAILMDQYNKLQAEKNNLQEQCSIRYEAIERLNGEKRQLEEVIKDRTKDVQHYDEENKKLEGVIEYNKKTIETWEETCEIQKKKIFALKEENDSLAAKYADSETMCGMLRDEVESLREELEKSKEAAEKELKELQVDNEWRCKALNEVDTKYRRLSVLIGEFVRQAVEL